MKTTCVTAVLLFTVMSAGAARKDPVAFEHDDWELACDNTRTCRAAGYQSNSNLPSDPVSMRITRAAGPGTAIDVAINVALEPGDNGGFKDPLRLKVGNATASGLIGRDGVKLNADQVRTILPELLKNDDATVTGGGKKWTLSLAGLNAVLLKMDEAQGRVGTTGALVRRGIRPESSALPAVPAPVATVVEAPANRPGDAALAARIFPLLDMDDFAADPCNVVGEFNAKALTVSRLSERKVLLSVFCSLGAYNGTSKIWIANDKPPYSPVALEANGDFDPQNASVTSATKGRGSGDCWWSKTWHFNGKNFVLTGESGDVMCRGFDGGAWNLPSYVSRIVGAPSTTPSKP